MYRDYEVMPCFSRKNMAIRSFFKFGPFNLARGSVTVEIYIFANRIFVFSLQTFVFIGNKNVTSFLKKYNLDRKKSLLSRIREFSNLAP